MILDKSFMMSHILSTFMCSGIPTIHYLISGFVFPDTAPYKFAIEEGRLKKGVHIEIRGQFSGEYFAIARASLRTNNNDTIFRIALRFVPIRA